MGLRRQKSYSIDCHGGNVRIVTDKKASGLSYEIAQKVSMSGGKAKHFLERPEKTKNSAKPWELWKDLCNCTTFDCTEPTLVVTREKVWSSFNKMVKLMNKSKTTFEERCNDSEQITLQIYTSLHMYIVRAIRSSAS